MNTGELFIKELRHRPFSFLAGVVAAAAAAACVTGARGFLTAHDLETGRMTAELEQRADERMAELRDEARIFSKSLGFNILLLPPGQEPGRLYADNRSTHYFSPEQVQALGAARFNTLNHLLPMLRHRVHWDAYDGDVILVGVEGELYIKAPSFQKPIEERIEPGRVHLGDAVRRSLDVQVGDTVELLGEPFKVHRLLPSSGSVDDISVLMNLGDAQRLAGQPGRVSGLLALSCNCAAGDVEPIRRELTAVVPGAQVVEFAVRARARQRARDAVARGTREEMEDIRASRMAVRGQAARTATVIVALVIAGTVILLVVLTAASARERSAEVAMLRALGLGSGGILALFLYKALITGLAGGVLGCLAGLGAGHWLAGPQASVSTLFTSLVVGAAVLVAIAASALPAALAAGKDPAVILNRE